MRLGTLQAIPIGESIVWVRPWYVQAEQTPIPQLSFVVVAVGDQVYRARTLEGALKLAFPDSNVDFSSTVGPLVPVGPTTEPGSGGSDSGSGGSDTGSPTTEPATPQSVAELLTEANRLYEEGLAALKEDTPDFATYQANIQRAFELVAQAESLAGAGADPTSTDPSTPDTTANT